MTTYSVLSYSNLDELTGEVNRKTAEGWRPQGGMAILPGEMGFIFLQGMVMEENQQALQMEKDEGGFLKGSKSFREC